MRSIAIRDKTHLEEIDVLKGIAIIGVILLHLQVPFINISIQHIMGMIIVHFSMPIFMFVSGLLFGFSRSEISSFSNYITFIVKKFKRLMVPYFVVAGIILLLKYFAADFVVIRYPVDHYFWKYLLFNPYKGETFAFLWFLYVLYFVFLVFPILNKLIRNSLVLFLLIFSMKFIPIPEFFYFNLRLFIEFLLYFCLGYLYSHWKFETIKLYSRRLCILFSGLLLIIFNQRESVLGMFNIFMNDYSVNMLVKFITTFLGVFMYYYLSVVIKNSRGPLFHVLKNIGMYSASIYLLHTISMGAVRVVFVDILNLNSSFNPFISIVLLISGIVIPIILTKYIIYKFNILPPLILGIKKSS